MGKYRKSLSRRAENMACPVKTLQFPVLPALMRVGLGQCGVALHSVPSVHRRMSTAKGLDATQVRAAGKLWAH